MNEDAKDFLAHYGKIGMKWGRRSGSSNSADYTNTKHLRNTSYKKLSNDELKTAISRLNLEKQYRDVKRSPKNQVKNWAVTTIAVAGTVKTLYSFVNSDAGKAIVSAVKSKLGK